MGVTAIVSLRPVGDAAVRVVPVWATPPDVRVLAMLGDEPAPAAAALRIIRHRLERRREEDGASTYAVTSARDGEGKSTFAVQLALALGEAQRARVLLVEANFRHPAIARILGFCVPTALALSAQIARRLRGGTDPWTVSALGPCLHVLAETRDGDLTGEALHSACFAEAIRRIGSAYDWVVLDAPSVLGSGDANVVENVVDGVVVVARSRASRGADVRAAMKQLGDRKAAGVVLWDA